MEIQGKSKRKEPRFPLRVPISISIGQKVLEGETRDISYSGIYIATTTLPPLSHFIRMKVDFPEDLGSIELSGMVSRRTESPSESNQDMGIAVQLYGNGDDVLKSWNKIVAAIATGKYGPNINNGDVSFHPEPTNHEDNLIATIPMENLSPEDLLKLFAIDIPNGRLFVATDKNLALGNRVRVDIIGNSQDEEEFFSITGKVVAQQRKPGQFGVELSLTPLEGGALEEFWKFICSQTTTRYPPINFPNSDDSPPQG